jgi:hypothetical protein
MAIMDYTDMYRQANAGMKGKNDERQHLAAVL